MRAACSASHRGAGSSESSRSAPAQPSCPSAACMGTRSRRRDQAEWPDLGVREVDPNGADGVGVFQTPITIRPHERYPAPSDDLVRSLVSRATSHRRSLCAESGPRPVQAASLRRALRTAERAAAATRRGLCTAQLHRSSTLFRRRAASAKRAKQETRGGGRRGARLDLAPSLSPAWTELCRSCAPEADDRASDPAGWIPPRPQLDGGACAARPDRPSPPRCSHRSSPVCRICTRLALPLC